MDPTQFKEIGSFAVVVVPVVGGTLWLVKMLFTWFTKALDARDAQLAKLVDELVSVMRETQQAHAAMIQMWSEGRAHSAQEHQKIIEALQQTKVA